MRKRKKSLLILFSLCFLGIIIYAACKSLFAPEVIIWEETNLNEMDRKKEPPENYCMYTFLIAEADDKLEGYAPIYKEPNAILDELPDQIGALPNYYGVVSSKTWYATGWISADLLDEVVGYVRVKDVKIIRWGIDTKNKSARAEIIKNALRYLGRPFVPGGTSLEVGIDSPNFINQIYAMSGYNVPDTTNGLRDAGVQISYSKAKPGDLVYYEDTKDGTGLISIYLGGGLIIQSSGNKDMAYPQSGVRIRKLSDADENNYQIIQVCE